MKVYLGKDKQHEAQVLTATHATVTIGKLKDKVTNCTWTVFLLSWII
jgi:hypothetical protein